MWSPNAGYSNKVRPARRCDIRQRSAFGTIRLALWKMTIRAENVNAMKKG